ncbi:beta-propeller domain-containing protein [Actinokineospora sp. HUAS TT18]|uniref:beta-propeller domain-containing protein n=1 Tax=Actinokineospora sp. HUAS TT18 TaxID=3447451 RepID=UPI003F5255F0
MSSDLRLPRIGVAALALAVAGGAVITTAYFMGNGASGPTDDPPPVPPASGIRLVAFDSCDKALADLKSAAMAKVGPYGLDGDVHLLERGVASADSGAAAPEARQNQSAKDYSGTNNHESAADEPDLVKTDGKRIVSVLDGQLRVVDVASRKLVSTLALPSGAPSAMLLDGDHVLITSHPNDVVYDSAYPGSYNSTLTLTRVDLAGGARVAGSLTVDGSYIDGRQVGSVARIVIRSTPRLPFVFPQQGISNDEALKRNRDVIGKSKIQDWIPRYNPGSGAEGQLYDCTALSRAADYTGTSVLSVLTFDLRNDLGTGDGVGLAADGDTVYGTANSLYIADDRNPRMGILPANARGKPLPQQQTNTTVHQFDISVAGKPVYLASGAVMGSLLNQYSLSEHKGNLRIATTKGDFGCCDQSQQSESSLAVLTRRGAELVELGRVDGLGKTERIQSVRFIGDTAYVVTFRRTDPLYTVDLADPAKPKVTGELKITGYSAYLHPVAANRLLGVGQDATDQGRVTGTQVSLFDISGGQAKVVTQFQLKGASSEVENDPHAFLYWAEKGLLVVPVVDAFGGRSVPGALVLRLNGDSLTEAGRLSHPSGGDYGSNQIRRSLVAGGALWTVSGGGMMVTDLGGLNQLAWVPFA